MRKSKFISLARTLNEKELYTFSKYLKRLHCNDYVAINVFDYIRKHLHSIDGDRKLDIDFAYKKVFDEPLDGNRPNRVKMLNALSDLHLWLKEYLLLEKLKSDSFESRVFWMAILKERGLTADYARKAALLQREVEKMPKSTVLDYMKGMASNYFFYYHLTQDKQKADIQALSICGYDLDVFYAVSRLKIACEMANRQNQVSQVASLEVLPAIAELSKSKTISNHPLFLLYLKVYELVSFQQHFQFKDLEHLLKANRQAIDPEEFHAILSYLHNHIAVCIRRGDDSYWEMAHNLNMFAVENSVFDRSGEISSSQFNNIVNVACISKDLKWASSFIKKYEQFLPEGIRRDAVALAEAMILFEEKRYMEAVYKLSDVTFSDLPHAIRSKSLILRSYFEIADGNLDTEGFCLVFELYLKRHQTPKRELITATANFVKIVKKLIRRKETKEAITHEIQNANPIYFKSWLLEKAADYEA